MNIEQYRAIKAQEEALKAQPPVVEQPITAPVETKPIEETKPVEVQPTEIKEKEPITVEIDGKKLTLDELKNGYLRQADYTKKTQELSRQRTETKEAVAFYEYLKQNPQIAQQVVQNGGQVPDRIDPSLAKVKELEEKMYDMILEREIETLSQKYDDFEVKDVLSIASEKGISNLEDAYFIFKSRNETTKPTTQDIDELKEQIRKDLLKELQEEASSTKTIISTNTQPVSTEANKPTLTEAEMKVAKMMKITPQDYIKWRDADKVTK